MTSTNIFSCLKILTKSTNNPEDNHPVVCDNAQTPEKWQDENLNSKCYKIKTKVCVFPCGTEMGVEIFHSLNGIKIVELIGINNVYDSSYLLYSPYMQVDFDINALDLVEKLVDLCKKYQIDILIPAHDMVIDILSSSQSLFNTTTIFVPSTETYNILRFNIKTYKHFQDFLPVPRQFSEDSLSSTNEQIFVKAENNLATKNNILFENGKEAYSYFQQNPFLIATEFLPGEEYTIDCYTNITRQLLCITVNKSNKTIKDVAETYEILSSLENQDFIEMAHIINQHINLWGVWFFQAKKNKEGKITLLKIANKISKSYSLSRFQGFNGLEMQVYETLGRKIDISPKLLHMGTLYRTINCQILLDISFSYVYVDLDDTIIQDNKVNHLLISQLYRWRSKNSQIILLTKHKGNLTQSLNKYGLSSLFHEIHHILTDQPKSDFIKQTDAIFIDDSFRERTDVEHKKQIPCFSPESAILIAD